MKIGKNILKSYNILKDLYYNINNPSSFSGINTILNYAKQKNKYINYSDVKDWLRAQKSYSVHFPIRLKFKRNPIVSRYINHIWFADLIEIKNFKDNDNVRYVLTVIDNLSKKGFAEPLLNKKAETVKKAFLKIFNTTKTKPHILITDAGTEFTNQSLKKYIRWRKIKHLVLRDNTKASNVERWNRTIKELIEKYLTANKTKRFIGVLDNIVANYNNKKHSRTKFKPNEVTVKNQREVYRNLYRLRTPIEIQKFKVGDKVRVVLTRGKFDKGYIANYSDEIFYIYKIYNTSPYYKYRVKDFKGNLVRGSYYAKELVKIF